MNDRPIPKQECPMKGRHMTAMHRDACQICNPKESPCTTPQAIDTTQNTGQVTTTTEALTSNKRSFERVPITPANMPTLADYDAALVEIERLSAALEEAACVLDSEAPVAAQRARKALSGDSPAVETSPSDLTEAERLLQAWADPLPPNGTLYWAHVEKAREYFRRRGSTETRAQPTYIAIAIVRNGVIESIASNPLPEGLELWVPVDPLPPLGDSQRGAPSAQETGKDVRTVNYNHPDGSRTELHMLGDVLVPDAQKASDDEDSYIHGPGTFPHSEGCRCERCSPPESGKPFPYEDIPHDLSTPPQKASEDRRPTGQCSWGCYYNAENKLVRDPACTVHGAS